MYIYLFVDTYGIDVCTCICTHIYTQICTSIYQDCMTTAFTEHRTDVGRFWPANTTKRSPNTNTNKPFNVQPFTEHRTQRSPLSSEQNVEHNNIFEHNIEQNSERRTSSKKPNTATTTCLVRTEHRTQHLCYANRTSNTTLISNRTSNRTTWTRTEHRTQQSLKVEHNNVRTQHQVNTTVNTTAEFEHNEKIVEHNSEHNRRFLNIERRWKPALCILPAESMQQGSLRIA